MTSKPEEELDLSAGMVAHHPLGRISGFDHETGLPIVKRQPQITAADHLENPGSEAETGAKPVLQAAGPRPSGKEQSAQSTKPSFEEGQRVVLPDGTKGRIAHVVRAMKTARVRTDDGRNLTVRHSALKAADAVLVKEHYRRAPS
jgi:preprotein translocase subunit YajC